MRLNVAVRPDTFDVISLCTGGGGLDLGLELAIPSARSVVLVEREAFAVSHLVCAMQQGLMAPAPVWSDVTTFAGRPWRGLVDGLIGGIPCQPHSLAGKREGSDDERDLWSDARRIIVQARPWFVLIENVRGMLSAKPGLDPGALRVWRDLRRLGFSVEGGLFTASEVGASHERERIFILAVADDALWRWHHPSAPRECSRSARPIGGCSGELANASGQRSTVGLSGPIGPDEERHAGKPLHGGDALVIAPGERRREGRAEPELWRGRDTSGSADSPMGDSVSCRHDGRSNDTLGRSFGRGTVEGSSEHVGLFPPGPNDLRRWRNILEAAPELEPAFRRVADGLASRLDIARVDRLRMLGNGVVPLQAAYAIRTLATRLAANGSTAAVRLVRMNGRGE